MEAFHRWRPPCDPFLSAGQAEVEKDGAHALESCASRSQRARNGAAPPPGADAGLCPACALFGNVDQGSRLWIQDGTGELLIFVPERMVDYLPAGLGTGVRLRITGEVDIYQGQLEIIPQAGGDVEVR